MDIDEIFKQIQKETLNSKLKIDQCNTHVVRGLKAYHDDLLRKQAEIEKGIDAHIAAVVEETKPRKLKYQEFRNEKIATFNKVRSDTDNEIKQLEIKIQEKTELLRKNADTILEKMNTLAHETQNAYTNLITMHEEDQNVLNDKCNNLFLESTKSYNILKEELMKSLKYALEVYQQINKESYENSTKRADKNRMKYDKLIKKFQFKFENIKFRNK